MLLHKSHKQSHHRAPPKVTHPALVSDDDDIFGSAEDYDESSDVFVKQPTKTSSDNIYVSGSNHNNHHYPYNSNNANTNGNAGRYNIPLFSNQAGGGNSATNSNGVVNGINGNSMNGNNAIVTRTEVRGSDNEVSTSSSSNRVIAFNARNIVSHNQYYYYYYCRFLNLHINYYTFLLFAIHLLISMFGGLIVT